MGSKKTKTKTTVKTTTSIKAPKSPFTPEMRLIRRRIRSEGLPGARACLTKVQLERLEEMTDLQIVQRGSVFVAERDEKGKPVMDSDGEPKLVEEPVMGFTAEVSRKVPLAVIKQILKA